MGKLAPAELIRDLTILPLMYDFVLFSLSVANNNSTHPQPIIDHTSFCPSCIDLRSSVFFPLHDLLFIRNPDSVHNLIEVIQIFILRLSLIEIRTLKTEINLKPVLFELAIPDSDSDFNSNRDLLNYQVLDILDLPNNIPISIEKTRFPEFHSVKLYERTLKNWRMFGNLGESVKERMKMQGIVLIQCAIKWFLTTGRQLFLIVVAIVVLVAELSGVGGVIIQECVKRS